MFPEIWLGSQESFYRHIKAGQAYLSDPVGYAVKAQELIKAYCGDDDEEDVSLESYHASMMTEIQGSVGIVSISGALVSESSWWGMFSGEVSYSTIATAINKLLENPAVETILTAWASPGGDASGISDLGSFIKDAGKVKPIHAWTGKSALSAAYWAAASCKTVRASELGETGSIGVIATFTSVARMLKEDGIDVHIERSSPSKAPLHPAEPLSKAGVEHMQEKVATLHDYFVTNIELNRPKLRGVSRDVWAGGKTFYAKEAISLGLVDGPVISLGALISKLNSANRAGQTQTGGTMAKQILLSEQARAQVALGVPIDELPHEVVETPDVAGVADEPAQAGATAEAQGTPDTAQAPQDALADYLKAQLTETSTKLAEMTAQAVQMQSQLQVLADVEAKLAPIVIQAINRIQIGLGQTPTVLTGLPAATLEQQYKAVQEQFEQRMPSGRKSMSADNEEKQPVSLAESRLQLLQGGK